MHAITLTMQKLGTGIGLCTRYRKSIGTFSYFSTAAVYGSHEVLNIATMRPRLWVGGRVPGLVAMVDGMTVVASVDGMRVVVSVDGMKATS